MLGAFCLGFCAHGAEDWTRYENILKRAPFGAEPVIDNSPPPINVAPPPPPPNWKKDYVVTTFMSDEKKTKVGFKNVVKNTTFILSLGETEEEDGLKLVRVDTSDKAAVLIEVQKDGVTEDLEVERRGAKPVSAGQKVPSTKDSRSRLLGPSGRPTGRSFSMNKGKPQNVNGAELENSLRKYNEQIIRDGLPPLPIPLTPDQQNRLSADGIISNDRGAAPSPSIPIPSRRGR